MSKASRRRSPGSRNERRATIAAKRAELDFKTCGRCGADALENCAWDPADGWCCRMCGGCDSDE